MLTPRARLVRKANWLGKHWAHLPPASHSSCILLRGSADTQDGLHSPLPSHFSNDSFMVAQQGLSNFSKQNSPEVLPQSGETLPKHGFVMIKPLEIQRNYLGTQRAAFEHPDSRQCQQPLWFPSTFQDERISENNS